MLQKTMVVVEGVARTLDPQLNMWQTSEPVVRGWIEENLGPLGRLADVSQGAATLGRLAFGLSDILVRAERLAGHVEAAARSGVRIADNSIVNFERRQGRRRLWPTVALWVIAAALILMLWRGIV